VPMGGAGEYIVFRRGDAMVAGMMHLKPEWWGEVPPHWMVYFAAKDAEVACAETVELGGHIRVPPTLIPGIGQFAVLSDPEGAFFSVLEYAKPPS
jgi:predicted enzyme related to lactoylglutathione lyase